MKNSIPILSNLGRGPLYRGALLVALSLCMALPALAIDPVPDIAEWKGSRAVQVAEAASVSGDVVVLGFDHQERRLAAGDPIYAGERVVVGMNSSAGIWLGEVLAQLEADSRARVTPTHDGGSRITLEKGAVRVLDPRESGPAMQLVALDASTSVVGGDLEARIMDEKAGAYAMIGDWKNPANVRRGNESMTAQPGRVVVANPREPLFDAPGHDERLPLLAGAPPVGAAGPPVDTGALLDPSGGLPDVGAGPPVTSLVDPVPGFPRALLSPCGTVGVGCKTGLGMTGIILIETQPTTDPFPGSQGVTGTP